MTDDQYAPFPEHELLEMADDLDMVADMVERSDANSRHPFSHAHGLKNRTQSAALRNAVQCHDALRERCLLAEQALRERDTVGAFEGSLDDDGP